MSDRNSTVELTLYAHAFSQKSVGVSEEPPKPNVRAPLKWIPRSQITTETDINGWNRGDLVKFEIPEWLAHNEGLI